MSDPAKYRSKEEVEEYKKRDPITQVLQVIQKHNWATEQEIEAIEEKVKREIDEAVQFAEESPWPDESELYRDVYVQPDYPFIVD